MSSRTESKRARQHRERREREWRATLPRQAPAPAPPEPPRRSAALADEISRLRDLYYTVPFDAQMQITHRIGLLAGDLAAELERERGELREAALSMSQQPVPYDILREARPDPNAWWQETMQQRREDALRRQREMDAQQQIAAYQQRAIEAMSLRTFQEGVLLAPGDVIRFDDQPITSTPPDPEPESPIVPFGGKRILRIKAKAGVD